MGRETGLNTLWLSNGQPRNGFGAERTQQIRVIVALDPVARSALVDSVGIRVGNGSVWTLTVAVFLRIS
jgi:hypothetical protein